MVARRIVMVEGKDDEHVIKHLCGNRGIPPCLTLKSHDGVEDLLDAIPVQLKATNDGDVVGVVLDADDNAQARWEAIHRHLLQLSYTGVPTVPAHAGTIIDAPADSPFPRVGIWLMPDNQTQGILENFLAQLVPGNSALFERVKRTVAGIPVDERLFPEVATPKALIHTWLAWQEKPGLPLGTAITARFLDPCRPEADSFVAWLRELFRI